MTTGSRLSLQGCNDTTIYPIVQWNDCHFCRRTLTSTLCLTTSDLLAYLQGHADATFYSLQHWASIDVFIYFSHHLVTIPTPGWIVAGHRHGVQVGQCCC